MRLIAELLARYKNLGYNERLSKEAFVESANKILGRDLLTKDSVSVRGTTAFIKAPGVVKTEILLNKETIIKKAGEKAGPCFVIRSLR